MLVVEKRERAGWGGEGGKGQGEGGVHTFTVAADWVLTGWWLVGVQLVINCSLC